jgi:hypothetical protein
MAGRLVGRDAFGRSPGSGGGTDGSNISATGGSAMAGSPADGPAAGVADGAGERTGAAADAADHGDDGRIGTGTAERGGPAWPSFFGEVNERAIGWSEPCRDGDAGPTPVVRDDGSDTGDGMVAAERP